MKIILAILLAVWFIPIAGAQNNPVPAQPSVTVPAQSVSILPITKPASDSTPPVLTVAPTQPASILPMTKPASNSTPPAPAMTPPVPTATPGKLVPLGTTALPAPNAITVPEPASFIPFHSTATVQSATPAQPEKKITIHDSGEKSIDTVAALKKKQVEEIKALRESLKNRPNAEIRKAVAAKQAEHKAAIKALQAFNKAEKKRL